MSAEILKFPTVPAQAKGKPKVLWVSDCPSIPFVGQSIVSKQCLDRLKTDYDVTALGFGSGEVQNGHKCEYPIIPCVRTDLNDGNKTLELLKKSSPDLVLFSHDPWLFPSVGLAKSHMPNTKFLGWLTVDGEPAYYAWRPLLTPYDKIICPCDFSKRILNERWLDLWIDVVPYGVDTNLFHFPQQGKDHLKNQLSQAYAQTHGNWFNIQNKFVAIFAGANQDRKNLGLMMDAWERFERDKLYDVVLISFIHSASLKEELSGSYDLTVFMYKCKTLRMITSPVPTEVIAQFMSAADVLLHMSAGEGFGLTVAESLACGTVPVILPYAALGDFCNNGNSYCVPFILHTGGQHVNRALSSTENVVAELEKAFHNREELALKSSNAIQTAKQWTWERTVKELKQHIDEVLSYEQGAIYVKRVV